MEQEILDKIKKDYNKVLERKKYILGLIDEISKLEDNDIVKKYIKLKLELDSMSDKELIKQSDQIIFESTWYSYIYRIKETNEIFVYLGTFMSGCECDIIHGSSDIRLSRDDPRAEYRIYRNIEDGCSEYVSIKKCDKFEMMHNVIIPNTNIFTDAYFFKLQKEFFSLAVFEGQEEAKRRILEKK